LTYDVLPGWERSLASDASIDLAHGAQGAPGRVVH
jgi:hypothetical protein